MTSSAAPTSPPPEMPQPSAVPLTPVRAPATGSTASPASPAQPVSSIPWFNSTEIGAFNDHVLRLEQNLIAGNYLQDESPLALPFKSFKEQFSLLAQNLEKTSLVDFTNKGLSAKKEESKRLDQLFPGEKLAGLVAPFVNFFILIMLQKQNKTGKLTGQIIENCAYIFAFLKKVTTDLNKKPAEIKQAVMEQTRPLAKEIKKKSKRIAELEAENEGLINENQRLQRECNQQAQRALEETQKLLENLKSIAPRGVFIGTLEFESRQEESEDDWLSIDSKKVSANPPEKPEEKSTQTDEVKKMEPRSTQTDVIPSAPVVIDTNPAALAENKRLHDQLQEYKAQFEQQAQHDVQNKQKMWKCGGR